MKETVEVVVRESGSIWPDWLNHKGADDRIVVSEDDAAAEEADAEFSFRVLRLLSRVTQEGKLVRKAVVLFGKGGGNPNFDARRMLSRALVSHMDPTAGSELTFAGCGTPENQEKLLALVGALGNLLTGTSIDVSLRFCAPGHKKGEPCSWG